MKFLYFRILFLRLFLFCLCNIPINSLTIMLFRDRISQVLVGINSNPVAVRSQFRGRLLISAVASKIENVSQHSSTYKTAYTASMQIYYT
jgi:hypothetical protein